MFFLILAILCSTVISVIMRLSSEKVSARLSMLAANYLVCSFLGAFYADFDLFCTGQSGFSTAVVLGLVNGVLFLGGFVLMQDSTRKNGVVLTALFMKLGLLVPMVVSVLFFDEIPALMQIIGFALAIAAIFLINMKKEGQTKAFSFSLILLLLFAGGADAMAKVYDYHGNAALSGQFLFYGFLTAFTLCLVLALMKKEKAGIVDAAFGVLIGVPNFFCSRCLLASLGQLPAVVVYPSFSVGTMMLVTVLGVAAFKERLSKLQWLALVLILAALVLLNI